MQRLFAFLLIVCGLAAVPAQAEPHIALLLPLNSGAFGRVAEAVKLGFTAAATVQVSLPIKIYGSGDQPEETLAAYQEAVQAGARVVVGPLTRNAVARLAGSGLVSVPTLALNTPEKDTAVPPQLYLFGLAADMEARQVARLAFADGRKSALVAASGSVLAKRMQAAFAEEWQNLGGRIARQTTFVISEAELAKLKDFGATRAADMIFLAADAREARLARPYLDRGIPTYATSHVYGGAGEAHRNIDLTDVQFIDMPWLLQPDHPAVMVYPHPPFALGIELERFYALGIDAWRLARLLLDSRPVPGVLLDGVTGQIILDNANHLTREMPRAEFQRGEAVLPETAQ